MENSVTSEDAWVELLKDTPLWQPAMKRTVVVAPHPDDETLGAGGLIAIQRSRKVPVVILAVTDGGAAYPDSPGLGEARRVEQQAALHTLGVEREQVIRFSLPDSSVTRFEYLLGSRISSEIDDETLLLAPWPFDPHPDHEACGRAAIRAAEKTGAQLMFYVFWAWHRNTPQSMRTLLLRRLEISADLQTVRANALACHRSQLERADGRPILPEIFLAPARRTFETFIVYG